MVIILKIQGHKIKKFIKGSRFFYNHGNAIWNIDSLLTLQSTDEGPYQNECGGTERAWRTMDKVYIITAGDSFTYGNLPKIVDEITSINKINGILDLDINSYPNYNVRFID